MWPRAAVLSVPTAERVNLGGKTLGLGPQVRWTIPPPHTTVKRGRSPDPKPPPPAAWQPRREPSGPAPSRGTQAARPTPDAARSLQRRVSRQKAGPKRDGRGVRTPRKGGGASRARARTECPDAALRQSGPEHGLGTQGKERLRRPSTSIRVSRFKPRTSVPPNRHLK